jgi:plasmid stability protein
MATLTIRNLDDRVRARLRVQAAKHGRSMEEEAREILKVAVEKKPEKELNPYEAIRRIVDPLGGIELNIPPRQRIRKPPNLLE